MGKKQDNTISDPEQNEIINTSPQAKDATIARLTSENLRLQRRLADFQVKLDDCRQKKAQALISRMTLSTALAVQIAVEDTEELTDELLDQQADYWFYALIVELLLRDIDADAALYSGDELRKHVNEATAGSLLDYFRRASMLIDNREIPEVKERVLAHDRAMHELVNKRDDGSMLRELARMERGAALRVIEWRERFGAPKGPRPIAAYVLKEVPYLTQLHGLPSYGAAMEKMMDNLKSLADVKAWQQFKIDNAKRTQRERENVDEKLKKQRIEVQVFERFDGIGRTELGEEYKKMKDNNKNRKARGS